MTSHRIASHGRRESGQTLVIALFVLAVLLVLGAVYTGIISRTIKGTGFSKQRTISSELAEAGLRYAHNNLVNSELGADWSGQPTDLAPVGVDFTGDPDAHYLRPAAFSAGTPLNYPNQNRVDRGGPDGLGQFFRVNFNNGRALIRVRYAPGDIESFSGQRIGALIRPGMSRNYLIIESVGRPGRVNPNDPTNSAQRGTVQFRNYASQAAFNTEFGRMKTFDEREVTSRKLIGYARIGIIDTARSIWNKFRVSRPAELGVPTELGAQITVNAAPSAPIPVNPPAEFGTTAQLLPLNAQNGAALTTAAFAGFGSLHSNADLRIHGTVIAGVNTTLGDIWTVAGSIGAADANSALRFNRTAWNQGVNAWQTNPVNAVLDSRSTNFTTLQGTIRDGIVEPDAAGYARGVGYIEPPSIQGKDSESSVNRYLSLTRDSGAGIAGQHGHGEGIYVNNASDFQVPSDEQGRQAAGASVSLVQDWLAPAGDGSAFRSGWRGPFYVPIGAFVRLLPDGLIISRNAHSDQPPTERTWRYATGADSSLTAIRYRFGLGTDGRVHVVNTLTSFSGGVTINDTLAPTDFDLGPSFNGVLYFDGNVRVRGIIPTDVQLTLVSNRTIYIEGSITKGVTGNDVTDSYRSGSINYGERLTRPSRSSLMLMAKDYVTVNPTMFFGPNNETNTQVDRGGPGIGGYSPVLMSSPDGSVTLQYDNVLIPDPSAPSQNPQTWVPASTTYVGGVANTPISTKLLLTHSLAYTNPGPSSAFVALDINSGILPAPNYLFETATSATNTAKVEWAVINGGGAGPAFGPVYGLGREAWQQSSRFESVGFPLVTPGAFTLIPQAITNTGTAGGYSLFTQGSNQLHLRLTALGSEPSGNYYLARAAVVPADVRIEASIYAEEGSFFVIPGDWHNPNPNDRRDVFEASIQQFVAGGSSAAVARQQAIAKRLDDFGATPDTPFFGEPMDVRIQVVGSVAENMPPPISQQAEWLKKWGWIPTRLAALTDGSGNALRIPNSHVSASAAPEYTTNLTLSYDPMLATGRAGGFSSSVTLDDTDLLGPNPPVRFAQVDGRQYVTGGAAVPSNVRLLPPMPRLPVSPTLAYFGEVN